MLVALPVAAAVATLTPLAPLAYPAVPLAALLVSAVLVALRRFVAAIEFSVWCWLLAALLRRVVELRLGYQPFNLVLLSPVVAAVPPAFAVLWVRRRLPMRVAQGLGAVLAATTVGTTLAVAQLPLVAAVAGAAAWLPPLALGLAVLLLPAERDAMERATARVGVVGSVVVGGYGVAQWLVLPSWDSSWMLAVYDVADSFGRAVPGEVRVFSTLNSPGPAAAALLLLVVLASVARVQTPVRVLAVVLGVAALGLTQVRQVYVAGLAFLVVATIRRVYPAAAVAATALVVVLAILVVPAARETVGERVVTSIRAGDQDESLNARATFQREQFGGALARPLGLGLGSTGSGVRASGSGEEFADADSGYLELVRSLGLALTALLLVGVALLLGFCRRARRDRLGVALWCLSLTIPVQLVLSNVFVGAAGAMTWVTLLLGVRFTASEAVRAAAGVATSSAQSHEVTQAPWSDGPR